ncbi:hypothetical protein OE165_27995, partial [Escherichia coli]|uniref:hypothetical protein n=1 Tax=Escherichia coli TaxID=562 RepID=UPI0021F2F64D
RNHKARLSDYVTRLRMGDVADTIAAMENAIEHWAPHAAHGMKQVFVQLQNPQLVDTGFPGYGRAALVAALRKK